MSAALAVSVVVLWIAVVALSVVVFALARQIGVLYERVAPAGALMIGKGPQVGEAAPPTAVTKLFGKADTVGSAVGADTVGGGNAVGGPDGAGRSTLVFFLSPTCPVCKTLLTALRSIARAEASWLRVVLAGDGARAEHESFARAERLEGFDYVLSTELGVVHGVSKLPFAVLIDAGGVVRSKGLVNSREHLESLFEASERGVASIQQFVAGERERAKVA